MVKDLERIMLIVCEVGKISQIQPDDDIFEAGFSSVNVLQLLVELETALEVSIPDDQFIKSRSPERFVRSSSSRDRSKRHDDCEHDVDPSGHPGHDRWRARRSRNK